MPQSSASRRNEPAQIAAGFNRVLSLRNEGRRAEAIELCETTVAAAPRHADLRHVLGVLWVEAGEPARAIKEIERAIVLAPRQAEFYNSLGITLRTLGAVDRAMVAFRKALTLEPDFGEAHHNLGAFLLEQGKLDEAALQLRAALRLKPDYAEAAFCLASALARLPGAAGEVITLLRRLTDHPVQGPAAKEKLIEVAEVADLDDLPSDFSEVVCAWLSTGTVAPGAIERLSWRLVLARPRTPDDPSRDILLNLVLSRCLAISPESECLVLERRRKAIALAAATSSTASAALGWLLPLALQCFNSGYVYPRETEEDVLADRLRTELEAVLKSGDLPDAVSLALFGLFAPLSSLSHAERLLDLPVDRWPASLQPLLQQTLIEPLEEFKLRAEIPSLGAISNTTSNQVRAQYETHPYPRWIAVPALRPRSLGAMLREHLPRDDVPSVLDGPIELLVAGCGTGWSVSHAASIHKEATIIGVDLSLASLAYGRRACRASGFDNTTFIQGDLFEIGRLGRRFPYIECSGGLHHMADPLAGWQTLVNSLAPSGLMYIALYFEIGRRSVVAGRAQIQALGLKVNDTDIRKFRRFVLEQPRDSSLAPLTRYRDFYYLNGCRDLLFHEVEHRFDLPRVKQALDQLGLEFLAFNSPTSNIAALYQAAYPNDPLMRDLDNWHRLELANPTIFASMYQFWCRPRVAR